MEIFVILSFLILCSKMLIKTMFFDVNLYCKIDSANHDDSDLISAKEDEPQLSCKVHLFGLSKSNFRHRFIGSAKRITFSKSNH